MKKFIALFICLWGLGAWAQSSPVYLSFEDLDDYGVQFTPDVGAYESTVSLNFEKPANIGISYKLGWGDSTQYQKFSSPISIKSTTLVQIKLSGPNTPTQPFLATFVIGRKHTLPIVCLTVQSSEFFPPSGIYEGTIKIEEEGKTSYIGNAWKKNEINCHAEFIFNGKEVDATGCKLKTFGGWTLGMPEKSLHLIADEEVGDKSFKYKFFPTKPFNEFEHLVLRTSGSDQNQTRFKDMSISSFAFNMGIDYMAYQPTIMYVNGKYFGIVNLREKINEDYIQYNHHANKKGVTILEAEGNFNKEYEGFKKFIQEHYLDNNFPTAIEEKMDVENYFNYSFLEIYIANVDSRGNIRYWKDRTQENKWRWIYYDGDLACATHFHRQNFLKERISPVQTDWYNPTWATHILRYLTSNPELRNKFINQACLLMSTVLQKDTIVNRIDYFANWIRPEIPYHVHRWPIGNSESEQSWNNQVKWYRNYWEARPVSMLKHVQETFQLGDTVHVNLQTNFPELPLLVVNESRLKLHRISGTFFKGIPLPVSAVTDAFPYTFEKWNDGNTSASRLLTLDNSVDLAIQYKHLPISALSNQIHLRRFGTQMKSKKELHWIELVNASKEPALLANAVIYNFPEGALDTLPALTLPPLSSVVLTNNDSLFKAHFGNYNGQIISSHWMTSFGASKQFYLGEGRTGVIDSLLISFPDSILAKGNEFVCEKSKDGSITYKRFKEGKQLDWKVEEIEVRTGMMKHLFELPVWIYWTNGLAFTILFLLALFKKVKTKNAVRYFVFVFIAVALLYWAYKDVSFAEMAIQLAVTNWWWIAAALIIEYVSVIFRGIRWNQLLAPLGHKANVWNAIHAVAFGYCMNDLVPRSGEVARCTLLFKSDKIPVHTLIGTVIVERVIDMVMFGLFLVAGILFLPATIQSLFNQTKGPSVSTEIVIALLVLFAAGIVVLRYVLKHNFKNKWLEKIAHFIRGTWNAFASVSKIKGKFTFIALTFGIWMSWLVMTYFNLLALPGSAHMGFNESLFLLICASLAMLAPTPGGLGAYHSITVIGFIILGYADADNTTTSILGLTYATISWATRTFAEIATGFVGFLIVTYRIRRAEQQRAH